MPTKQPPRVQFNYEPELTDVITEEINPNFVYPDGEEGTEDHDISMEIEDSMASQLPSIEKEDIVEHDIFQQQALPRSPKQQQTRPQQVILEQQPQQQQRVKGVNKNGKPRKPMSEEHKAKLAMAREKAQIARKAKAQERKNDRLLDTEEKELIKKQKVKRVKKLKEEVEDDETEVMDKPQQQRQQTRGASGLTMEDIQKAQMDAIMAYENVRKARKEEKKKAQMIEQQKTDMIRKIQQAQPQSYTYRARDTSGRLVNKFDNCY